MNVSLAGVASTAPGSELATSTVTPAVGCDASFTVKAEPPTPSSTASSVSLSNRPTRRTAIVNSSVSASLAVVFSSESVTVYVYAVAARVPAGVPDSIRVEGLKLTPSGGSGDSE